MSILLPLPRSLKDPLGRCQLLYVSIRANFASSAKLDDYGRSCSAATIVLLLVDKIKGDNESEERRSFGRGVSQPFGVR